MAARTASFKQWARLSLDRHPWWVMSGVMTVFGFVVPACVPAIRESLGYPTWQSTGARTMPGQCSYGSDQVSALRVETEGMAAIATASFEEDILNSKPRRTR